MLAMVDRIRSNGSGSPQPILVNSSGQKISADTLEVADSQAADVMDCVASIELTPFVFEAA
ncbi:MAG: hypothetical protein JO249_18380 [Acidobacteria bacterium]|nr:hypothetical protein [Acidobacteriota bacterium]